MKKILFIPILLIVALTGFVACNDDNGPAVIYFWDEPAIVDSLQGLPIIKTAYGSLYAPNLKEDLTKGTHLWLNHMLVNQDLEKVENLYTAEDIRYTKINISESQMLDGELPGNEDTFTDSIDAAILYNTYIDNFLYFRFEQQAPEGQEFEYVLYCKADPEDNNMPTFYIKAKRVSTAAGNAKKVLTHYGFDMTNFLDSELGASSPVKFNIQYKIGTKDGKDVYKPFKMNPISWKGKGRSETEYN